MPVIGIPVDMLLSRVETKLDRDALVENLQYLGCDVEGYATLRRFACARCGNLMEITETENPPVQCDSCGTDFRESPEQIEERGTNDVLRMELLAVRPDMFDPGGLARVLRHYFSEMSEASRYQLTAPTVTVSVDPKLSEASSYRPEIACAVIRNMQLDDDKIKVIMKLQENLHWALGRDRKHASIGVYDLDTLNGTKFRYRAVAPDELQFTPLGFDPSNDAHKLTPAGILAEHPKGQAYARLLEDFTHYPLLEDESAQVLSLPPIINSEQTRLRQESRNFFIDVTGSGRRIVNRALNILVTSLAELDPNITIEQVTIASTETQVTPDLTPQKVTLEADLPNRVIGFSQTPEQVAGLLHRMGHDVSVNGDTLEVSVPAYRNDILHPIDLVEDAAIAFGYHNLTPSLVPTMTVGAEQPYEVAANYGRRALTGLGFYEVLTLILSSEAQQFEALGRPAADDCVVIDNPISREQTIVRRTLLPGLLDTLAANADHEMPQRIFEIGNISIVDAATESGAKECPRVAAIAIGPKIDFADARSMCSALLSECGWQLEAEPSDDGCFIPGRGAFVYAARNGQRNRIGTMGEIHPEVLERFKLVQPAAAFELDFDALMQLGRQ